jgi:hypothetical protein
MRHTQILMSIFALLGPVSTQRADDIPKRFNFDRYSAMLNRSPFAVATAVALPVTADFAKDLYVGNAARSPEGDMVTIASTADTNFKEYLTTKGPVDGYSIASIEWSDRVGATKVTISKDGKFATIGFNEAFLADQPVPNVPPVLPNPGANRLKAAPIPTLPTPPPHRRGVIQRNPPPNAVPNVPPPDSPDSQ